MLDDNLKCHRKILNLAINVLPMALGMLYLNEAIFFSPGEGRVIQPEPGRGRGGHLDDRIYGKPG